MKRYTHFEIISTRGNDNSWSLIEFKTQSRLQFPKSVDYTGGESLSEHDAMLTIEQWNMLFGNEYKYRLVEPEKRYTHYKAKYLGGDWKSYSFNIKNQLPFNIKCKNGRLNANDAKQIIDHWNKLCSQSGIEYMLDECEEIEPIIIHGPIGVTPSPTITVAPAKTEQVTRYSVIIESEDAPTQNYFFSTKENLKAFMEDNELNHKRGVSFWEHKTVTETVTKKVFERIEFP